MLYSIPGHENTTGYVAYTTRFFIAYTAVAYFLLLWDYFVFFPAEWRLITKTKAAGGWLSQKWWFLASRYLTLIWCTVVVLNWFATYYIDNACMGARGWPFGFSVVGFTTNIIMALRIYAIFDCKKWVMAFFGSFAVATLVVELVCDYYANAVFLVAVDPSSNSRFVSCFLLPRRWVFIGAFLAPTVYHHTILLFTLYRNYTALKGNNLMNLILRDNALYVLTICLINFTNVILIAQRSSFAFKLINQLPAAVFTQIFLSRIVFNLKARSSSAHSSASISPLPISFPTSSKTFSTPKSGHKSQGSTSSAGHLHSASSPEHTSSDQTQSGSGERAIKIVIPDTDGPVMTEKKQ